MRRGGGGQENTLVAATRARNIKPKGHGGGKKLFMPRKAEDYGLLRTETNR